MTLKIKYPSIFNKMHTQHCEPRRRWVCSLSAQFISASIAAVYDRDLRSARFKLCLYTRKSPLQKSRRLSMSG